MFFMCCLSILSCAALWGSFGALLWFSLSLCFYVVCYLAVLFCCDVVLCCFVVYLRCFIVLLCRVALLSRNAFKLQLFIFLQVLTLSFKTDVAKYDK